MRPDILILEGLVEREIQGMSEDETRSHINGLNHFRTLKTTSYQAYPDVGILRGGSAYHLILLLLLHLLAAPPPAVLLARDDAATGAGAAWSSALLAISLLADFALLFWL